MGEPTEAEITRAAWAWRNEKDRETDSSDDAYFRTNWRSLPGLRAYVTAQVELGRPLADALRDHAPSDDAAPRVADAPLQLGEGR